MKSIVLKLAGPLQSWGTNSYFETRHTDLYPSKSIPYEHTLQEQNYEELIHYAVNQLKSAKKAHDELETYYVKHMDFDRVSEKLNEVLIKIKSIK